MKPRSSALAGRFFATEPLGKPLKSVLKLSNFGSSIIPLLRSKLGVLDMIGVNNKPVIHCICAWERQLPTLTKLWCSYLQDENSKGFPISLSAGFDGYADLRHGLSSGSIIKRPVFRL